MRPDLRLMLIGVFSAAALGSCLLHCDEPIPAPVAETPVWVVDGRVDFDRLPLIDHLEPCSRTWPDSLQAYHEEVVAKLLPPGVTDDTHFEALRLPSFQPESGMRIREWGDPRAVEWRTVGTMIWEDIRESRNLYKVGPVRHVRHPIVRLEAGLIAESTAKVLERVWRAMILESRYPATGWSGGLDGDSYFFRIWIHGAGSFCGATWSPNEATRPGRLVAIVNDLERLAVGRVEERPLIEEKIRSAAEALLIGIREPVLPSDAFPRP